MKYTLNRVGILISISGVILFLICEFMGIDHPFKLNHLAMLLLITGYILVLVDKYTMDRDLLNEPLRMKVLAKVDGIQYVAIVLVNRRTGRISAPENKEERMLIKATEFDIENPEMFRVPLFRIHRAEQLDLEMLGHRFIFG